MTAITLKATSARKARTEAAAAFPNGCDIMGYDEDGINVFITTVREHGNRAPIATAYRNRSKKAIKFVATDDDVLIAHFVGGEDLIKGE